MCASSPFNIMRHVGQKPSPSPPHQRRLNGGARDGATGCRCARYSNPPTPSEDAPPRRALSCLHPQTLPLDRPLGLGGSTCRTLLFRVVRFFGWFVFGMAFRSVGGFRHLFCLSSSIRWIVQDSVLSFADECLGNVIGCVKAMRLECRRFIKFRDWKRNVMEKCFGLNVEMNRFTEQWVENTALVRLRRRPCLEPAGSRFLLRRYRSENANERQPKLHLQKKKHRTFPK